MALILAYVCCFALGCGPIPWILLSEVLPPRIKGPAASVATAACWVGNLLVTLSFDTLLSQMGIGGAYLLYSGFNVLALWFVSAVVVETKCRSLADIEDMLLLPEDLSRVPLLPQLSGLQQQQQHYYYQQQQQQERGGGLGGVGGFSDEGGYVPAGVVGGSPGSRHRRQQQQQQCFVSYGNAGVGAAGGGGGGGGVGGGGVVVGNGVAVGYPVQSHL